MNKRCLRLASLLLAVALSTACGAARTYRAGEAARKTGDLDEAVTYYRQAAQASPDNASYQLALQRAMQAASQAHADKARQFEEQDQLDAARSEYQLASDNDPGNRQLAVKVTTIDRTLRDRLEASRPRPAIEQLRERARAAVAPPLLNPASHDPLRLQFRNVNIRDILDGLGTATGITVSYDPQVPTTATTVVLEGLTFEQALQQIMATNQIAYKVTSEHSMLVFPDTQAKHAQYDEQVVQTFYLSNADPMELVQLMSALVRFPTMGVQPVIQPNKAANSITVRATPPVVQMIDAIIQQNDKARAELMFDIEILEVNRTRAKQYGLNLSEYAVSGAVSPGVSPGGGTVTSTAPSTLPPSPAIALNTLTHGLTSSDFWLGVPTAIVRFLESDTTTKLIAKPQLRGADGNRLTMNLGDEIPIVTTSYVPIATGGVGQNPLNSFQLKPVGINVEIMPVRVTLDGDIIIDLVLESSSRGADVNVAGTNYPSFGSRKVSTRLQLRDGESNLLAGLLRDDERKALSGVPGAMRVPLLKQLFSGNDQTIGQTDIVMLLTPHILRRPEIGETDLRPVFIGAAGSLGLNGPPPLIAAPDTDGAHDPDAPAPAPPGATAPRSPASAPGATPRGQVTPPPGTILTTPPGASPVPGTVVVPAPAATTP
ncbi:MAG: hypothetical protein LBQ09_03975 [Acidobacteriaceae bacterium]|nr:hypothetical protein [Acidobacteriaceae bacterium]